MRNSKNKGNDNYVRKKVTCMDCGNNYYEMVLRGRASGYNFRCENCSGYGISMFGRKGKNEIKENKGVDYLEK